MEPNKNFFWHLAWTIFASLAGVAAVVFFLFRYQDIWVLLRDILAAMEPVFMGIALAYILCPIAKFMERHIQRIEQIARFARVLSVLFTLVLAFGLLGAFCALVLPQLVDSVNSVSVLLNDLPNLLEVQIGRITEYLKSDDETAAAVMQMITSVETSLVNWIRTNLFSTVSTVATSVLSIGSAVVNIFIAIILTIYLLMDRERYLAQCRKMFYAISKNKRFNRMVFESAHQANRIFGGFVNGKLLDSLIVGIICFICLTILNMPYALLISVIVGVTNIIPMFGPFIGAIPSAFLVLLVSPTKCIIFLVFILILQQVDGNIIGPRILGNSTGLSALYVTIAMLLFGKLLGFLGMIIGVPLFATLYYIVKRTVEYSLKKKDLPTETSDYMGDWDSKS